MTGKPVSMCHATDVIPKAKKKKKKSCGIHIYLSILRALRDHSDIFDDLVVA